MRENHYHKGICFWTTDRTLIINFPKQHMDKLHHQAARDAEPLQAERPCPQEHAQRDGGRSLSGGRRGPSYFLEGMLWNLPNQNLPNQNFTWTYQQTFKTYLYWLEHCDRTQLACANDLHWLIRDGAAVCWNMKDFQAFLSAARLYWNSSGR